MIFQPQRGEEGATGRVRLARPGASLPGRGADRVGVPVGPGERLTQPERLLGGDGGGERERAGQENRGDERDARGNQAHMQYITI